MSNRDERPPRDKVFTESEAFEYLENRVNQVTTNTVKWIDVKTGKSVVLGVTGK